MYSRGRERIVLALKSTDERGEPRSERTRGREGKAGHDVPLGVTTGETLSLPTVSPKLQWIAETAVLEPKRVLTFTVSIIVCLLLSAA
jgi:hypothetical protein